MSHTSQHLPIQEKLARAIHQQRCVLVLGPHVCCDFESESVPMSSHIATHLADQFKAHKNYESLINRQKLSHVAKVFEDTPLKDERLSDSRARQKLESEIKAFYKQNQDREFSIFAELASMPFHIIIDSSHYDFLSKALRRVHKRVQEEFFHYKDPEHNTDLQFSNPTVKKPWLYNLFGSIEKPQSLVVTEKDKIHFVETIMQGEPEASLPTNLRSKLKDDGLTFLFMGFDFEEWHLQILLHILELDKQAIIALQDTQNINKLTQFTYEKHFYVDFHVEQELDFIEGLKKALNKLQETPKAAAQHTKNLFIMYAKEDEHLLTELENHLEILRRNEKINIWHEGKLMGGDVVDDTIVRQIDEADIILLLVTSKFLASDKLYEIQLQQALARHDNNEACIIPILMSACMWEHASFANLFTLLPEDEQPISKKKDRQDALKKTAEEINEIINHYWT